MFKFVLTFKSGLIFYYDTNEIKSYPPDKWGEGNKNLVTRFKELNNHKENPEFLPNDILISISFIYIEEKNLNN